MLQRYVDEHEHSKQQADGRILAYARNLLQHLPHVPDDRESAERPSPLISHLSNQELRVFRLLVEGLSNRSIAERMGIVVETVKKHCRSIYRKLGVKNRREAAIKFGTSVPGAAESRRA